MKKDLNYYRNAINIENKLVLLVVFIAILVEIIFSSLTGITYLPVIILSVLTISYCSKQNSGRISIISLINSAIMIFQAIVFDRKSIFALLFIILGILMTVHSILYLKKLKEKRKNEK